MGDSGRTISYNGDPFVWKVENGGEVAWYVAECPSDALKEHERMAAEMSDGPFTVAIVQPDVSITIHGDAVVHYPPTWRDEDDETRVTAFAAEFAAFHADDVLRLDAIQLCTTEY